MPQFIKIDGQGAWWKALRSIVNRITPGLVKADGVPGWERAPDGRWIPPRPKPTTVRPKQLEVRSGPELGQGQIYYGEASGLGFNGVIDDMTENEWTIESVSQTTYFYLKVEFEPESEARVAIDGAGGTQTVYVLGDGGSDAEVSIDIRTTDPPEDQNPTVDPETGAVQENGIYYRRIGSVVVEGDTVTVPGNSFYGPVGIAFCRPNNFKYWQVQANG